MNLNFIPPSISNGVSRVVVDREEVTTMKLSWKATCAMFVVVTNLAWLFILNFL